MGYIIQNVVDRVSETNFIVEKIRSSTSCHRGKALVLWSDSGYGKSAIISKVNLLLRNEMDIVIVKTPPTNLNNSPIEGQYISYIANAINEHYQNSFSFEGFLTTQSRLFAQKHNEELINAAHTVNSAIIAIFGKQFSSGLNAKRLLYSLDADSLLIQIEYIQFVYRCTQFVLDISNFQNIDTVSFTALCDILQKNNDIFVILEYTTENNSIEKLVQLLQAIPLPVDYFHIDALPFEFALSIYNPLDYEDIGQIEKYYHDVIKGNLYKLQQVCIVRNDSSMSLEQDPLLQRLSKLSYGAKLLLAIICLHDGKLSVNRLMNIRNYIGSKFLITDEAFTELGDIVLNEDNEVEIAHSSVSDTFGLTLDNYAVATAYHYLKTYYQNVDHDETGEKEYAVLQLLKLFLRFDPSELPPLFTKFQQLIIASISEKQAFKIIEKAFDSFEISVHREYAFTLINLCYQTGLYSGALELCERMQPLIGEQEYALYCMLLNRTDNHRKSTILCKEHLMRPLSNRMRLIYLMIKMLNERSMNNRAAYQFTALLILVDVRLHKYLEYGFFLRNLQILLPYRRSIPMLKKSIDFFLKKHQYEYAAYSALTYIIQQSRLGEVHDYRATMEKIQPYILGKSFEKHILYVNEAAIRLLQDDTSSVPYELLLKARLTATTTFDLIAIYNNLIAFCIANHITGSEFELFKDNVLKLVVKEPDIRSKRKVYVNLYLYYKYVTDDVVKSEYWKEKAIGVRINSPKPMVEDVFLGLKNVNKDIRYLAGKRFCVSFITYWHFCIPLHDTE